MNRLISDLERLITRLLKDRIKSLDLIASGTMYNETSARVIVKDLNVSILVDSTDYFIYLDAEHDIVDYVLNLPPVINLIGEIQEEAVFERIDIF